MTSFVVKGLKDFTNQMSKAKWALPADVDRFMNKESKILINKSKNASPYPTFKKRWFTKTKRGSMASIWKAVLNKAPHLHLILNGHEQVGHRPEKKRYGRVPGNNFLEQVLSEFETQYYMDMEKFMNGVWE